MRTDQGGNYCIDPGACSVIAMWQTTPEALGSMGPALHGADSYQWRRIDVENSLSSFVEEVNDFRLRVRMRGISVAADGASGFFQNERSL